MVGAIETDLSVTGLLGARDALRSARPLNDGRVGHTGQAAFVDDRAVGKYAKLREKILAGGADSNVEFAALCRLLVRLGFDERIKGSHHIFTRNDADEIMNLQPKGTKAKAYQVKQVRNVLVKYRLGEPDVD